MIEIEFYKDKEYGYTAMGDINNLEFVSSIEIVLSKEPRADI